ncbi:MAG: fibronectin-binding autotransporter adhesin, partial [Pirellulaceae bacterium]
DGGADATLSVQTDEGLGNTGGDLVVLTGGTLALGGNIDVSAGADPGLQGGTLISSGVNTIDTVNVDTAATIVSTSGTLEISTTLNTDPLASGTGATVTFDGTGNTNVSGVIGSATGTGDAIIKEGTGTTTFAGVNTYDALTNVNVGVLALSGAGTLGVVGAVGSGSETIVADSATLLLNGFGGAVSTAEGVSILGSGFNGQGAINSTSLGGVLHFGFHINSDALALDLNNNGGMLGGGDPTSFQNFFGSAALGDGPGGRGLDFDNDADFINAGVIGQNDNYSNLWIGIIDATSDPGSWTFHNNGDDDVAGIWVDINGNGTFESSTAGLGDNRGEQVSYENTGVKTVALSGIHLVAFTHREGGGGSSADFRIKSPSMTAEETVNENSANQGFWLSGTPNIAEDVIMAGAATISSASGELQLPNGVVASSELTFGGSGTVDVVGVLTGGSPINKIESGTVVLANGGNDFTNTLTASAGTVSVEADGALGDIAGATVVNGTLEFSGTFDYTELELIDLEGTVSNTGDTLVSAPITLTGNGTLSSSSGTLSLLDGVDATLNAPVNVTLTFDGAGDVELMSDFGNALNTTTFADSLAHYGFHINNDASAMDLNSNGGMMGGGSPSTFNNFFGFSLLTDGPGNRGLDFNDDNDFRNTGSIGQNDNYSNLWLGTLHVDAADAGVWGLRNAGDDDRAGHWIDLNQNGVFESSTAGLGQNRGEQLSWENTGNKQVTLAAGDYLVAFTHREGGGGSRADFRFTSPGDAERIIKPSDPAQAGLWNFTIGANNQVVKQGSGTATMYGDNSYNGLTTVNGGTLVAAHENALGLNASTVDVGEGTVVNPGGTLGIQEHTMPAPALGPVIIAEDIVTNGSGAADRSGSVVNIAGDNTLISNVSGSLANNPSSIVSLGSEAGSLTIDGDIEGDGFGAITFGGAGDVVVNGTISNEGGVGYGVGLDHFGFHINNDNLALNLNGNAGMMGGGDPTTFNNFQGQALLTDGPGNRGLDYNNDADFRSQGAINQNDNYSDLFVGTVNVSAAAAGPWTFDFISDDDRVGFWIDLDQDGTFESDGSLNDNRNEQITWDDGTARSVDLTEGTYLVAFTHREGGGGSQINMNVTSPTFGPATLKPTDPAQLGVWRPYVTAGLAIDPAPFLDKSGTGTVVLNSANAYDGPTDISGGTLVAA